MQRRIELDNGMVVTLKRRKRSVKVGIDQAAQKSLKARIMMNTTRRVAFDTMLASVALIVMTLVVKVVMTMFPYAISINGEKVCYVDDKKSAKEAIASAIEDYLPEGTSLKAVDSNGLLEYKLVSPSEVDKDLKLDPAAAGEMIKTAFENENSDEVAITIAAAKTEMKPYTPEPNYKKDETMLAGDSRVEKKGVDGEQKVTTLYTIKNGAVISKGVSKREVLDEGTPATIYKGTLGLPEGEDWETYEGLPVFRNGAELTVTAQEYLGSPYKYGGYSFKTGIDCVQFVRALYKMYGISLPNGKTALRSVGRGISLKDAQKGDIVCYPGHYAIYLGDGKIIHASSKGGVKISNNVKYKKILTIRRVVK